MAKKSAGLLIYRRQQLQKAERTEWQVLLVHPGGPFWQKKDAGAWSIPKGEFTESEDPLSAAIRETKEETGFSAVGKLVELSPVKQKSGKIVYAWASEADFDLLRLQSNFFEMEWPPRSGKTTSFPEIDRAGWFGLDEAAGKMLEYQLPLLEELKRKLADFI